MDLRLRLLGPFAVELGAETVAVGGAVRRRLLAILVLERNRTVPADRLAELLWGDDAPQTAANTLQVHVAALRRTLAGPGAGSTAGPDRLRTEAGGYRLVTRPDEVDVDAFDADVADARRWAGLDRPRAIQRLDAALARWRGDVLADIALPAELLPAVAGLEARRQAALDLQLRLRLAAEDARAVLPSLEALVAADPANESWVGLLMLARYRAGRQADALAAFQAARRHLLDELGLDPSPPLRRLELAILRQAPELDTDEALGIVPQAPGEDATGRPDRLPAELTSFIGRTAELAGIPALLAGGARVVTVVGIGGAGKSRLANRAARAAAASFADGAVWVDLVAATTADQVAEAIAMAFGVREQLEPPFVATLPTALRDRHALLVLDNCEPVTVAVGQVLEPLLAAVPGATVIATSREPLGLAAEHLFPIDGLAVPDAAESDTTAIRGSDAVALLLERARAASPRRAVSDTDLDAALAIVRRLDGLPLAIEMAAAWLRSSSVVELAARLAAPAGTLELSGSTTGERHRTLRTAFDSSIQRL
ncbi:MAG TPA: BTAD domain-containing putative transcriptional regulator, partial [Candidatus Limnocylindrales bacterium]